MYNTFGVTISGKLLNVRELLPHLPFFIIRWWRGIHGTIEVSILNTRSGIEESTTLYEEAITFNQGSPYDDLIFNAVSAELLQSKVDTLDAQGCPVESIAEIERFLEYGDPDTVALLSETHFGHILELLTLCVLITAGMLSLNYSTINRIRLLRESIKIDYLPIEGYSSYNLQVLSEESFPRVFIDVVESRISNQMFSPLFPSFNAQPIADVIKNWRKGDVIFSEKIPQPNVGFSHDAPTITAPHYSQR